jgi:hypothetical protein
LSTIVRAHRWELPLLIVYKRAVAFGRAKKFRAQC